LANEKLPVWYKRTLFNELYFLADGGTVWLDVKDDPECQHQIVKDYGRFAYLEGHEYRMYNTYDVHFNANFALLKLYPKLQLSLQYEFSDTIRQESSAMITSLMDGVKCKQKAKNSLPHDIGDPYRDPWITLNAYNSHDTKNWKDLNLKFILTVYRDYYHLKDRPYLEYMWPFIKELMITVQSQDYDNDGLIDSQGQPDQTYDAWSVTGASAYCGGLHVATLQCVCEIAKLLEDSIALEMYQKILAQASQSYDTKLWNGKYYKYDCSNSNYHDSIMTDMCCGHWYLRSSGFKHEAFSQEKIDSCLETIFEFNVMKYGSAKLGSVNGMRPNGSVDITSMQSEEMWIGVTCSLAALMIYEDKTDKAWQCLEGMYDLLYNQLGLAFQTPEALMRPNVYRSLGYMRALCIWSVQYALDDMSTSTSMSTK
jgi:non-lysosomal glucosylceramidase